MAKVAEPGKYHTAAASLFMGFGKAPAPFGLYEIVMAFIGFTAGFFIYKNYLSPNRPEKE
jgi:hypothetical protein